MPRLNRLNKMLQTKAFKACDQYGASMGRSSQKEGNPETLLLQKVKFEDGCYDLGGAYWGGPENLWCAFSNPETSENDPPIILFLRADTKQEAATEAAKELPGDGWKFR